MREAARGLPRGFQRKIQTFSGVVMVILFTVGCLMCGTAVRSMWSYREAVTQLREIQELKQQISKVSVLLQNHIVSGMDNLDECTAEWERMSEAIYGLRLPASGTLGLLAEDFRTYQRNTGGEFYRLTALSGGPDAAAAYTRMMTRQEDRQFLCDLLLSSLTARLSDTYPILARESAILLSLGAAVFIYLFFLTLWFARTFSEDICQPVRLLARQAEEIMEGNYCLEDLRATQDDELGYLTAAFNEMKNRVRENFRNQEELFRLESLLRDAELRALQSQVNPHFLFNVLGLATEAALTENADQTVDILENISYLLHYSLTSVREDAWLSDELKMVRSYLFLQQRRFGDRLSFSISAPLEIPRLRIPGMTLQPIVENAVKHGVEHMTSGGRVEVLVTQTAEAVALCVRDNGRGIPPQQLEALEQGKPLPASARSTGLGLANVRSRLTMFYGRPGLMRVESREGLGTSVYLNYLIQKEAGHVPHTDCGR